MTILEKLSFSNKTRATMLTSPETRLRAKMVDAIDRQIEAVKVMLSGETYVRRVARWVWEPTFGDHSEETNHRGRCCGESGAYFGGPALGGERWRVGQGLGGGEGKSEDWETAVRAEWDGFANKT